MAVRRLNHAVLYVHDLAGAVGFYTEALGFEVRSQMGDRAAFLRAPGSANDHDLGLFALDGAAPIPREPRPGSGCTTWRGRSARSPNSTRRGSAWPTAAPWSVPATTGCPSRCTRRTPAASSSR